MEDPRLEGAARLLEDASKTTEQLSAKIKEAARQTEQAADHATSATAALIQELEAARTGLLQDIGLATDQTKAAAAQAAQAATFVTQRLNAAREGLLQDIQTAAQQTQRNVEKTNQALEQLVREAVQAIKAIRRQADDAGGLIGRLAAGSEQGEYCLELVDKGQEIWSEEDEFIFLRRTEGGHVMIVKVPTQAENGPEGEVVAVLRKVS